MEIKLMPRHLPNIGVVEGMLPKEIMDNIWKLVDEAKKKPENMKGELAGNINSSIRLDTTNPLLENFMQKVLPAFIGKHIESYGAPWRLVMKERDQWKLESFWVNFQKKHEFNPPHDHGGVYSFVIWLKIPTKWEEQHNLPFMDGVNDAYRKASDFEFEYCDLLGDIRNHSFRLDKKMEGRMLFFPAGLRHTVYPFYNCEEPRISVAGNVWFKTK